MKLQSFQIEHGTNCWFHNSKNYSENSHRKFGSGYQNPDHQIL